ncbi:isoprenylcysteine carboxylmethyltransferase family protein [Thalassoglobus sp. JC818]|uniref:methyltransferase family protein n=1 Tax=Thalassoglobus sp. JC818 TaxID=3232136 RepID=UPI0034594DFF
MPDSMKHHPLQPLLLTLAQFGLAAAIFLQHAWSRDNYVANFLVVAGAAVMIWAIFSMGSKTLTVSPTPRESASLKTTGAYRWVRHPMYSALLLASAGCAFAPPQISITICWIGLLGTLLLKIRFEETLLSERFPEYVEYQRKTSMLIPFVV